MHWKYHAGDSFTVSRLPAAIFNRPIPNVETNIRVYGIVDRNAAMYLLPEEVLVVEGGRVRHVSYAEMEIGVCHQEYVEGEGHVYRDSQIIGQRWKRINRDGSPDRRFKENVELPVVRCGTLTVLVGDARMDMMTTNPSAPADFKSRLDKVRAVPVAARKAAAAP